ncbi:MAG: hypothetical protein QOF25_687, partial [Mycobacterium sp.]|nr:hypothetical protein [Mycobacterium sp.]
MTTQTPKAPATSPDRPAKTPS